MKFNAIIVDFKSNTATVAIIHDAASEFKAALQLINMFTEEITEITIAARNSTTAVVDFEINHGEKIITIQEILTNNHTNVEIISCENMGNHPRMSDRSARYQRNVNIGLDYANNTAAKQPNPYTTGWTRTDPAGNPINNNTKVDVRTSWTPPSAPMQNAAPFNWRPSYDAETMMNTQRKLDEMKTARPKPGFTMTDEDIVDRIFAMDGEGVVARTPNTPNGNLCDATLKVQSDSPYAYSEGPSLIAQQAKFEETPPTTPPENGEMGKKN